MKTCRVCRYDVPTGARICDHCGEDLINGRRPIVAVVSPPPIVAAPAALASAAPTKRCPFCAEEILSAAIVCKHCHRDLPPVVPPVVRAVVPAVAGFRQPVRARHALGGVLVVLAFFVAWFGSTGVAVALVMAWGGFVLALPGSRITRYGGGFLLASLIVAPGTSYDPTKPRVARTAPVAYDGTGASMICHTFVEQRLKAPASAKFPYMSTDNVTDLGGGKFNVVSYVDSQNSFGALIRNTYDCSVHWVSGTQWRLDSLDLHGR